MQHGIANGGIGGVKSIVSAGNPANIGGSVGGDIVTVKHGCAWFTIYFLIVLRKHFLKLFEKMELVELLVGTQD